MALSRSLIILAISATSAAARGLPTTRPLLHLRGGNAAETLAAEMAAAAAESKPGKLRFKNTPGLGEVEVCDARSRQTGRLH